MATLQSLAQRTQLELSDLKRPFYEVLTSMGVPRLDLQAENVSDVFIYPKDEPASLIDPATYSVDERAGRIFFDNPPAAGTELVIEGESRVLFSDAEIQAFVESAFLKHTHNRVPAVNYSSLPPVEDHLVAILAKIEALWVLLTSSAYDINIHAPEGMFIPRAQRFQQLQALIAMIEAQYKELSLALGVGLYRIEMFDLRRVSRLTGKLVPVYLPQEFDDTRPPQRVYPGVDSMGSPIAAAPAEHLDLEVFQGQAFEETIVLLDENEDPVDLGTFALESAKATLFRTPYMVHAYREVLPDFEITVDSVESEVTVTLSAEDTSKLESSGSYVWQLTLHDEVEGVLLLFSGSVKVAQAYPVKNTNVTGTR